MRILTQVLSVITIVFIISISVISYNIFNEDYLLDSDNSLILEFSPDYEKNILAVEKINNPIDWTYITKDGAATKPFGQVEVGDKITNCYGNVELFYGDISVGSWSFSEKYPNEYYDVSFNGLWANEYEKYDLSYDNQYRCEPITTDSKNSFTFCSIIATDGSYDINRTNQNLIFPEGDSLDSPVVLNYYIPEDDELYLYNQNLTNNIILNRMIRKINNESNIYNYYKEKVNITGNFSKNNTMNFGYLSYNDSFEPLVVSFEFYEENNATYYDNKTIEIIGYIYGPEDSEIWDCPYVKFIDSIRILS